VEPAKYPTEKEQEAVGHKSRETGASMLSRWQGLLLQAEIKWEAMD
jgi:hypothetical protein